MKISKKLSENIQFAINEYVSDFETDSNEVTPIYDLRKISKELNVLPLVGDFGHIWGLNISGETVCFPIENLEEIEIIDETKLRFQGMRRRVYFLAAREYSNLIDLMPRQSNEDNDCSECKGTGRNPINDEIGFEQNRIGCKCFGLGWLPKQEDETIWNSK